jgi:pyroglutamyl-peptidase
VLHYLDSRVRGNDGNDVRAGFIHVPYSEEQVIDKPAIPAMSVATMAKGIEAAIAAAHAHESDLKIEGGTLD